MLDARFSHLYFYQSLNRLQRGLSAIAELLVAMLFMATHVLCALKATLQVSQKALSLTIDLLFTTGLIF